jgi:phosphoribosylaminoimidazole carboxylase (NCAIR synthetase)
MLLQAAANYPVETYLLENDENAPAAHLSHHFTKGDIRNFDDVYEFGKGLDAITIEIESVNEDALERLEAEGVKVYPRSAALRTIKDKITQKKYYTEAIDKEIAQIIAISEKGETAIYPPVDMVFDPRLNLLDYQISPADLPQSTLWKLEAISLRAVKELKSPGIFAVELLVTKQGEVYVNETAPRVHNSGHHTIEGNYSSQFDMLWRVILGYPLGNTEAILPAAIVNLIGAPGCEGEAHYEGLEEVLQMDNVFVHIYGKKDTKPGRKMGHVTIISREKQDLVYKAHKIKNTMKVISKEAAAKLAADAASRKAEDERDASVMTSGGR